MQHRRVQFHQRAVLPQHPSLRGVQAHLLRDDWQKMVAPLVAEVPRRDLRPHVVAAKGRGRVAAALTHQRHVRDRRQRVPLQPQRAKPLQVRVRNRHLHHRVRRQRENLRRAARHLDHQRQHVEGAPLARRLPAQCHDFCREFQLLRIAQHRAVQRPIPRVADQLRVPDPDPPLALRRLVEDRHRRANPPAVRRIPQMRHAGVKHPVGRVRRPRV